MSAHRVQPDLSSGRWSVEESWRARVRATKLWFEFAAEQAAEAEVDSSTAGLAKARALEAAAREDYSQALRIFTDLVVRGKLPEDGASL